MVVNSLSAHTMWWQANRKSPASYSLELTSVRGAGRLMLPYFVMSPTCTVAYAHPSCYADVIRACHGFFRPMVDYWLS